MQMSVGFWTLEFAWFWKVQQYFIDWHWDGFLSTVAIIISDKDGHGLKVEKLEPTFSIFNPMAAEIT